ncbi:MAG: flagellar filament capping protein FliD [Burkholderiaceae bacterium]
MATNITGIGGAIDVQGIVSSLMEIEREPLSKLQSRASGLRSTVSEFGKIQSAMDKFQTAARSLSSLDTWRAASASSGDDTAVGVSAASGALKGSFAIKVTKLASHQTVVSEPIQDKLAVVGGGSLSIQLGTDDGGFAADPERPALTITVPPGATLAQVSAAINSADAGIGASLVTDAEGTRLMIRSTDSGKDQAFQLTGTPDGTGTAAMSLADLTYVPGQLGTGFTRTQTAANASFELNGLELESTSNQPQDVLENVAIDLKKVTETPIEVAIGTNDEAIREKMDGFILAYNELNTLIRNQTRYDAESNTAGALQGNQVVTMIQNQLRGVLAATLPEDPDNPDAVRRLSDAGLEVGRDGNLTLNEGRFELASVDPRTMEALFGGSGLDEAGHGFAKRFDTLLGRMLGVDGPVSGATDSLRQRERAIEDQQARFEQRLVEIETRLTRQYSALDSNVSRMSSALQSLSNLG